MSSSMLNKQALFLVQTPFQCLCMIEAISHYGLTSYDVFVPKAGGVINEIMVARLLNEQGIAFVSISADSWVDNVYKWLYNHHERYKLIFIGYYYSHIERSMAIVLARFRGQIIFLDDGTQALEIFSTHHRKLYPTIRIALRSAPFKVLGYVKLLKKPVFFTIYDVYSHRIRIEKNSFSFFIKAREINPQGVYIIGANSSALEFSSYSYIQLLEGVIRIAHNDLGENELFYCPHRRDNNTDSLIPIFNDSGVKLFNTRVSVEYDFIATSVYPKYVIGFTSNALFTLKILFHKSQVFTVFYELKSANANKETSIIREKLNQYGIHNLHVFNNGE